MKNKIWKSDLLNHVWGLKAYGQRDDAIKADENRFWNKLWHNEYSEYVPAFGWYFSWCHICLFQNFHITVVHGNKCPFALSFAIFSEIRLNFAKGLDGNTIRDRVSGSDGRWRIIIQVIPYCIRANYRASVTLLKHWQDIFMAPIEKQKYTCC